MTEKLCPDGLVFNNQSTRNEQCDYPFAVVCPEGFIQQAPQSVGIECPRRNGYFEHEDISNCKEYYQCTEGVPALYSCDDGLVFDEFTGVCQWEHTGVRTGCTTRVQVLDDGFSCPNATQVHTNGHVLDHARYIKPDDCRSFYICLDGKTPILNGCPEGTVFNDLTLNCDAPENVEGCEQYYEGSAPTGPVNRAPQN